MSASILSRHNFLEVQHAGDAWMKKIARLNAKAKQGVRFETG
ncbi:MAG: hypothetical protein ACYC35_29155 [Pirellulales bacterium]